MALGTTNISTTLVANTIGTGSNDVGTLCTSSKINMWSKKKPVILNQLFPDRSGNWWLGIGNDCGITATHVGTIAEVINAIDNNAIPMYYNKPTGGDSAPFRLADFAGYDHIAQPPFLKPDDRYYLKGGSNIKYIQFYSNESPTSVPLKNLGFTGGNYSMAIFKNAVNGNIVYFTSDIVNSGVGGGVALESITVDLSELPSGSHDVYFCMSTLKKSDIGGSTLPLLYPLPNGKSAFNIINYPVDVIQDPYYSVYVSGSNCTVKPSFNLINLLNEAITITDIIITYKHYSNRLGELETGETQTSIASIALAANEHKSQLVIDMSVVSEAGMKDLMRISYVYNSVNYVFESSVRL